MEVKIPDTTGRANAKINLTRKDVRDGIPRSYMANPVCMAVNRKLKRDTVSKITGNTLITFERKGIKHSSKLPDRVRIFLMWHDSTTHMTQETIAMKRDMFKPFSFYLHVPPYFLREKESKDGK